MSTDLFGPFDPVITPDVALYHAECLALVATFPDNSVDSIVTDPPYHLTTIQDRFGRTNIDRVGTNEARARNPSAKDGFARLSRGFMGKKWDGGNIAFEPATWAAFLRVLKPGGHLVSFGGTRTAHRMKCAIEDAGFISIRDSIRYECDGNDKYSPFLDSLTADQYAALMELLHEATGGSELAWVYGSGMAFGPRLKPAHEPIILARKPLGAGSVEANQAIWGTGSLNVDECRIDNNPGRQYVSARVKPGAMQGNGGWLEPGTVYEGASTDGRLPSNFMHDGKQEFPRAPGQGGIVTGNEKSTPGMNVYGNIGRVSSAAPRDDRNGSAGRFFYQAKADKRDRYGSKHPTVKPIALLRYLARLVTPTGGLLLEPFAGSGTMITAALAEGFKIVAIEREIDYFLDCKRRIPRP